MSGVAPFEGRVEPPGSVRRCRGGRWNKREWGRRIIRELLGMRIVLSGIFADLSGQGGAI